MSKGANEKRSLPWQMLQGGLLIFPLVPALGAIAFGGAILGAWIQHYRAIVRHPLNRAFVLLCLLLLVSSCFAFKPGDAFLGLANLLPFFIAFAALSQLIQTPAQLRRMAWICVVASIPIILLGLGQMLGGWTSPKLVWTIFGWGLEANGNPPGRMASAFMYANILAAYLLMVLMLALGVAVETFQTWRKSRAIAQQWRLLFLAVAISGNLWALTLTSSRNAWGAAAIGFLIFALYLGWYGWIAGVSAGAGIVLWASFGPAWGRSALRGIVPGFLWRRLSGEMYDPAPIDALRTSQWQFALEMTRDRPLLGWGLRNFSPLYEAKTQLWFGHPHNLFLMLSAEAGILALLLLCAIAGWILARAVVLLSIWSKALRPQWQRDRVILLAYIVAFASCVLFNFLDVTLFDLRVNAYGWILLSALCGVADRYQLLLGEALNNPESKPK